MRIKNSFLLILCFVINITYAQSYESYDFKPVKDLKPYKGLPDPFLRPDGNRVKTKIEWTEQKKYIISMLEHYQYGEMPPVPKDLHVKESLSEDIYDGTATRKLYTLTMKRNGKSLDLHFGLIKPKGDGPFPVVIKNDGAINRIPEEINREAINRGYIMCQFIRTDLGSDIMRELESNRDNGVFPLYPEYNWGTIAAWAWGYKLIIDYFEELDFVDINKIVATGHSRGGKTAFCAGIFEERIAITAPNSSGLGGTSSHQFYELTAMGDQHISDNLIQFPYWWTSEYYTLAGFETRTPFDAHFGKSVIAPRAFLNCHSYQDYWANPFGAWITSEAAKKVYQWLGVENNIAMHFRTGGHSQNIIDWFALLDFSDMIFYNKTPDSRFEPGNGFELIPYPTVKIPVNWDVPEE
jgi:hypothetical protein